VPPTEVDGDADMPVDENRQPPADSKVPWTDLERQYLSNPDLMLLFEETAEELPPRILHRCERLAESRRNEMPTRYWKAFSQ
jgi:hypothetical protein